MVQEVVVVEETQDGMRKVEIRHGSCREGGVCREGGTGGRGRRRKRGGGEEGPCPLLIGRLRGKNVRREAAHSTLLASELGGAA